MDTVEALSLIKEVADFAASEAFRSWSGSIDFGMYRFTVQGQDRAYKALLYIAETAKQVLEQEKS